jgi:dehydrogenase/reductase SDR family member 12
MTRIGARLLDAALDRSVVGGYTRLGIRARRAAGWPADPPPGALAGTVAAVTGGGSGLGTATAAGLAGLGASVLLVVRDTARAAAAVDRVRDRVPGAEVGLLRCDLSDLDDVRRAAAELRERAPALRTLVHNAGVLPARRAESAQRHEITLATHVLGPLLLTERALPTLAGGRVVFVSSGGMYTQRLPVDDPEYLSGTYKGATAYARSKRLQVAFTPLLARRWAGVDVHAMHPGWADTPGVTSSLPGFSRLLGPALRTAEEGADTAVWLAAADPAPPTGRFWHDRRPRPEYFVPGTGHAAADLDRAWRYCAGAAGLDPGAVGA